MSMFDGAPEDPPPGERRGPPILPSSLIGGSPERAGDAPESAPPARKTPPILRTTHSETQETAQQVPSGSLTSGYDYEEFRQRDSHAAAAEPIEARSPFPASTFPSSAAASAVEARPASNSYTGGGVVVPSASLARWAAGGEDPIATEPVKKKSWLDDLREQISQHALIVLIALVVVTVLGVVIFNMSRGNNATPIAKIKKHAREFDGQTVTVMGRVGQVFQIGASYTFYLHQGRDTIVVFSRTRVPVSRERLTVVGSISTGYLEGVPRVALFESGP
jgi:hypothetical protein